MTTERTEEQEREEFEKWAKAQGYFVAKRRDGQFPNWTVRELFGAWMARAALSREETRRKFCVCGHHESLHDFTGCNSYCGGEAEPCECTKFVLSREE